MLKETIEQRVNVITGLPMQGQRATGRTTAIAMSAIGLALASGQAKCVDHESDLPTCQYSRAVFMLAKVCEVIQTLNLKGMRAYIGRTQLSGYHVVIEFQPEQVIYYDLRK
ncbi:MAG: hypothetical protein [Caudoviricetes sp.]|nr:MAG: hypothetical protein [Caudoviricetes sp.]